VQESSKIPASISRLFSTSSANIRRICFGAVIHSQAYKAGIFWKDFIKMVGKETF
jgi:hypothetical protein